MLGGTFWHEASFLGQLLRDCSDVIGLESTASSDVANAKIVCVTGVLVNIPSGGHTGLQRCMEKKWQKNIMRKAYGIQWFKVLFWGGDRRVASGAIRAAMVAPLFCRIRRKKKEKRREEKKKKKGKKKKKRREE